MVDNDFAMYGVYDGHGPAGHDCSDLALRKLCSAFLNDPDRERDPGAVLTKVFLDTQEILMKQGGFDTSGTTCTIVCARFYLGFCRLFYQSTQVS